MIQRLFWPALFGLGTGNLLAIYSRTIHSLLYLPDYPIGRVIAHQIEERAVATLADR